jgi:hypothetical protein
MKVLPPIANNLHTSQDSSSFSRYITASQSTLTQVYSLVSIHHLTNILCLASSLLVYFSPLCQFYSYPTHLDY